MIDFLPGFTIPQWLYFLILILASWRISSILVDEDSPLALISGFRNWLGEYVEAGALRPVDQWERDGNDNIPTYYENTPKTLRNTLAGVFACVWCMSVWISAFLAVFSLFSQTNTTVFHAFNLIIGIFAISSGAILFNRVVNHD